jgi:hypothetical protein
MKVLDHRTKDVAAEGVAFVNDRKFAGRTDWKQR